MSDTSFLDARGAHEYVKRGWKICTCGEGYDPDVISSPSSQYASHVAALKPSEGQARTSREVQLDAIEVEKRLRQFLHDYNITEDDWLEMQALFAHAAELEAENGRMG
jgi:hypothetical protein